jgi:hypothetical protein
MMMVLVVVVVTKEEEEEEEMKEGPNGTIDKISPPVFLTYCNLPSLVLCRKEIGWVVCVSQSFFFGVFCSIFFFLPTFGPGVRPLLFLYFVLSGWDSLN